MLPKKIRGVVFFLGANNSIFKILGFFLIFERWVFSELDESV